MDKYVLSLLQLFLSVVCGGLQHPVIKCNETLLLEYLPFCGEVFESKMKTVDPNQWCNLTKFITHYGSFSNCTEMTAMYAGCFWPNTLAERFITGIHRQFFSNCTSDTVTWEDPPDDILTTLILVPVFLTAAMISLVVWCSKRGDIFG
ncbi:receptor activity-modifying protein 3 [Rana temporaria]|uniref:receptor activity-modifying protein 3 n=1 Tax=Rana temporaria TaxID=8407 RepID=UPI001AAC71DB|nr:receptor activity-modifying protein 3 [Rana temporaria]